MPQAFGAKAYAEVGYLWQRAALILWVTCLPITALWLCAQPLLILSGQQRDVAVLGASFLRCCCLPPSCLESLGATSVFSMFTGPRTDCSSNEKCVTYDRAGTQKSRNWRRALIATRTMGLGLAEVLKCSHLHLMCQCLHVRCRHT